MRTRTDFGARLEELRPEVDAALAAALEEGSLRDAPVGLRDAVRAALLDGGKRVRPTLCLLACEAEGGERAAALPAAVALEMVHAYSLVHDDLPAMDDDALRRGRPTLHVSHGEALAILAGDALQALAFEVLAAQEDAVLARDQSSLLARAAGPAGMVGGQHLDLAAEGRPDAVGADEVRDIHARKTGALLQAAFLLGARAAGADPEPWRAFGARVGALYQAVDDLLDAAGRGDALGKEAGRDAARGKATWVGVHGREGGLRAAAALADAARAELDRRSPPGRYDALADLPRFLLARL